MALTDRQLKKLAVEITQIKEEKESLDDKIGKRQQAIIGELERRGTKAIEHDGARISYAAAETVIYDVSKLQKKLSPKLFSFVTKPVINTEGLAKAVQDGKISPELLARFSTVRTSKPYVRISLKGE